MDPTVPTRDILWNIDIAEPYRTILMAVLSIIPIVFIAMALRRRWQLWQAIGVEEKFPPREEWGRRAQRVLKHVFATKRITRRRYAGTMHTAIFYSFLLLFIGTIIVAIQHDLVRPLLGWNFFKGNFYRIFSLVLELAGIAGIIGCVMALYRRYVTKPDSLGGLLKWIPSIWILLVILITGFVIEGARIASHPEQTYEKIWSFVGYAFSLAIPQGSAPVLHGMLWWFHLAISIAFLCTFGSVVMGHIFTTAVSVFMAREIPSGATPSPIEDIEEAETYGVLTLEQFNQRHLRDADSCVECGRCQTVCPAWTTGKPLSPKKIVRSIREGWRPLAEMALAGQELPGEDDRPELVGELITADELWSCTTCGACEQECPVMIEQIEKIVDMRRGQVLMKAEFPEELQILFNNLEQSGNPWGKSPEERLDWANDLDFEVPIIDEDNAKEIEYLFWVGCAGAYDARSRGITQSFARLLNKAGVKYAVLGEMETCTGDSALRAGNEYLYQILAQQNIETLNDLGVKKIVTACPHCFQTLGKDYKGLGGDYEVIHHSQLLEELIATGRLKAGTEKVPGVAAVHDSCYLARHNGVTEQPRNVVAEATGALPVDPERNRDKGLCCGAGGGRMWMEENLGDKNINIERTEELLGTGASTVVTSCPFCKTMLSDGVKACGKDDSVKVMDIAEMLAATDKKGAE
ncbi:4Fe-4S dicluster domain-containing protein [bacterium]|nr:4Fe-4S dicluster domain-containing protein [bacterium]